MNEDKNRRKIVKSILLFLCVLISGVIGYSVIEGWNTTDAIFMTVITLGTVGYGETHELSEAGRIFTIFLIVFGLGSAASVLNSFATVLIDTKLDRILGRKSMNSELKKMKGHVILCGFGQIGMIIAIKLQEKKIPFVVIDGNEEEIEKALQLGFVAINGEITADATLLNAGIKRAKTLVIGVSDITVNLTLSLAAKEINPEIEVIAQGIDRTLEPRITRAGADVVVYPMALGGEQISELIVKGFHPNDSISSEAVGDVDGYYLKVYRHFSSESSSVGAILENEKGIRAVAYRPSEGNRIDNPEQETLVFENDSLVVLMKRQETVKDSPAEGKKYIEIIWSDDYSIGDASIDEEHLQLIHLINRFNKALSNNESNKVLADTFDRLIVYTLEHFKNEEERMKLCNYPELESHKIEHQKLVQKLMDLNKEKKYVFPESISTFLNRWLIDHILDCDKKYQKYLR